MRSTTEPARSFHPDAADPAATSQATLRLRLFAICAGLATLVFAQSGGKVAADTKLDLLVSPLRLLARALTLWDPNGASGQLQNQGYGYLFPIGPFFLAGHAIGLEPWVVQRSWQTALVVGAFLGTVRLSRLLGVTAFWPKVAAGLAYALAPRMLSELGSISSELMPVAVLPWVMIPLVSGARAGSPRKAAARSGVALLFAGGVNAAATLAILPAPALWLLTRERGARRSQLLRWWALAVVLACTWWAIPLLLLGKYSPPFLNWIESSSVTTSVTNLLAGVRGVDHWEMYLGPGVWPAGWILVSVPAVILASGLVAAGGVAGLSRRDLPHGRFLRSVLVVGLILLTLGHAGAVGPAFSDQLRTWLDGPLNAFRNVHKFDPLIRLPIAIGLGHLLARARIPATVRLTLRRRSIELIARPLAALAIVVIGVLAVAPVIANRLMPQPRSTVDASWWSQTADWLAGHSAGGRALVVPGSPRPVYVWGATVDDALQPVARSPWAVRDGVPLAGAGYIRELDDVEQRLAAGRRDDVLSELLARAGMRYLLVRNDLQTVPSSATDLTFVHATIDNSPGFRLAAAFGPDLGPAPTPTLSFDGGASTPRPATEVYEVTGWSAKVRLQSEQETVAATGSADNLGGLLQRGLGAGTPVRFGADGGRSATTTVVTDGIRRRAADFGQAGAASATMTATQPFGAERAAQDYLPAQPGPLSVMQYGGGVDDVTASSSGASAGALLNASRANGPWSALDGDPATAWESSSLSGADGQWLQVAFTRPVAASTVAIAFAPGLGGYPTRVRVDTDTGTLDADVSPGPATQRLQLPSGALRRLRITVLQSTPGGRTVGVTALTIPGVQPTRSLLVPVQGTPQAFAFDVDPGARGACLTVNGRASCDRAYIAHGEEDDSLSRTFALTEAGRYDLSAGVRLRNGGPLDALLDRGAAITARASSTDSDDPRERAGAAVDGDPDTGWVADASDRTPTLTLTLARMTTIKQVTLVTDPGAPVTNPTQVRLTVGREVTTAAVPADGVVTLAHPVAGTQLRIEVLKSPLRLSSRVTTGRLRVLPVGLSEVRLNGRPNAQLTAPIQIGCGAGVFVSIDGQAEPLQVSAARADALAGQPVVAQPCRPGPQALAAGSHTVQLASSELTRPSALTLLAPGTTLNASLPVGSARPGSWGATDRTVQVQAAAPAVLVVSENFNPGWQAEVGGHRLRAVQVDGWQQGWLVPAGTDGPVHLRFAPQTTFTLGLILGALCVVLLLALAFVRRRARSAPEVDEGVLPVVVELGLLAVAAGLLLGVTGLVLFAIVVLADRALRRWGRAVRYWVGAALIVVVAGADAIAWHRSVGSVAGSAGVQVVMGAAVLFAVSRAAAARPARKVGREYRRSSGRSKP